MKIKNSIASCHTLLSLTFGLLCPSSLYAFTEVYNTAGTFEWICPPGVTSITVECWGGGGAGGGASRTSTANAGGGGGAGGGYARKTDVVVTPLQSYTISIPSAATSPLPVVNGAVSNGGTVSFSGDSVTVTAVGGQGGESSVNLGTVVTNGIGGTGSSVGSEGDDVFPGGNGATNTGGNGGAGGGGAGNANPGGDGSGTAAGAGGLEGGGIGGIGRSGSNTGAPGASPGGGGGGAKATAIGTDRFGGSGGLGQIRLTGESAPTTKANNELALNDPSSWTNGVPLTGDVAKWDNTVLGANTTILGEEITWAGIQILNPGGLVTIDPGNTLTLGVAAKDIDLSTATADLTLNCNVAMSNPHVWDVTADRTLTIAGVISGTGGVTKLGAGTVILSGLNTFNATTSGITISEGTLRFGEADVIPQGAGRGNVNVNGTLDVNGFSETINGLGGSGVVDTTAADAAPTLTIGFGVSNSNFTGVIRNTAGTLNLVKVHSGTAQLSGANTFTGTTSVTGGTLQLNNLLALQNVAAITITGGGNLSITPDGTNLTAPVTLDGGSVFTTPTALSNVTLSGAVGGIGGLTKDGTGTLTLSGALTYGGNTLVSAGTLSLASANTVSNTSTVTVAATGALLQLNYAGTDQVGGFSTGATQQPGGVYGHSDSGADNGGQGLGALDAFFAPGSGTLTVPVVASGYQNWASGFPGLTNTDPSIDFDLGGLDTGIEFVVGGNPTDASDDVSRTPTSSVVGTNLIFEYRRTTLANEDPNATIAVQYGSDLIGWTDAQDGVNGVNITENLGFYGADDQVVVTLPSSLADNGKIFARLNVKITTP